MPCVLPGAQLVQSSWPRGSCESAAFIPRHEHSGGLAGWLGGRWTRPSGQRHHEVWCAELQQAWHSCRAAEGAVSLASQGLRLRVCGSRSPLSHGGTWSRPLLPFAGSNGRHLLRSEQNAPGTTAGASAVIPPGSAQGHEDPHVHQAVAAH